MQDYILNKVIETPSFTARVFSPVLTEEERKRRMQAIHKATADLLKGVTKNV